MNVIFFLKLKANNSEPIIKEYLQSIIELRLQLENKNLLIERIHYKLEEQLTVPFWTEFKPPAEKLADFS